MIPFFLFFLIDTYITNSAILHFNWINLNINRRSLLPAFRSFGLDGRLPTNVRNSSATVSLVYSLGLRYLSRYLDFWSSYGVGRRYFTRMVSSNEIRWKMRVLRIFAGVIIFFLLCISLHMNYEVILEVIRFIFYRFSVW